MDKVLENIKNIALRYKNINKVILFGSRARRDNTDKSDYDIAVFSRDMDGVEQYNFREDIENINTLYKIDIIFIKEKHKGTPIYQNILKDGVIIMDKFQNKLNNFKNAVSRLHESIDAYNDLKNDVIKDAVIQRFEFTTELAWKSTREYLLEQGLTNINSPKSVMREAYNNNLITDDNGWLQILDDRNSTSHIYDEDDANDVYNRITANHIKLFDELLEKLSE